MQNFINAAAALAAGCLLNGCAFQSAPHSRLPQPEALSRLAASRSNHEAKRLFDMEPFMPEDGTLRTSNDGWIWQALTSSGKVDLMAAVTFKRDGGVGGVEVQILSHPHPVPAPGLLPRSGEDSLPSLPERPLRPPEIVPR